MDFSPKQYLLIYALIVTPIVVSFFFIRRRQIPTRLNLKTGAEAATQAIGPSDRPSSLGREKALNVVFQWNGHSWDAYEVLGLPAGASMAKVASAYQEFLTRSDSGSLPFYRAAYDAIMRSQNQNESSTKSLNSK